MTRIQAQLRPIAIVCTVAYVLGVIFAPTIAFACEGGGGEGEQEGKKILLNNTFAKFELVAPGTGTEKYKYKNDGPGAWTPGKPVIAYPEGKMAVWNVTNKCNAAVPQGNECEIEVEFISNNGVVNERNKVEITLAPTPKTETVGIRK